MWAARDLVCSATCFMACCDKCLSCISLNRGKLIIQCKWHTANQKHCGLSLPSAALRASAAEIAFQHGLYFLKQMPCAHTHTHKRVDTEPSDTYTHLQKLLQQLKCCSIAACCCHAIAAGVPDAGTSVGMHKRP